jgi:hypothetical protein
MQTLSPEQVRSLRGQASRAAFARRVGVTPNTVYRWELPDGAAEARRPRGTELEKLARLLEQPEPSEPARPEAAERSDAGRQPSASRASFGAALSVAASMAQDAQGASPAQSDDLALALVSVERVLSGEPRRGQTELVQLLATKRNLSLNARALASFGIALSEIVVTGDPKSALIAISPALADAEADRLDPGIAARVFAVAALTRALPLAALFDHGYVHAFAARAEALAAGHDPETVIIGIIATLSAGMMVGDRELLERGYSRLEELPSVGLRPLVALHLDEFNGLRPMMAGKATAATRSFEALAEKAEQAGYTILAVRTLAHQAQANLDNLVDPEQVLMLVRRARQLLSRSGQGVHHLLLARAEGEAHLRAGRPIEALAVMNGLEAWCNETGVPPLSAVPTWARILHLSDRTEGFAPLMARLRDCDVAVLRPICRAYLAFLEATEAFCSSPDSSLSVAAFERA